MRRMAPLESSSADLLIERPLSVNFVSLGHIYTLRGGQGSPLQHEARTAEAPLALAALHNRRREAGAADARERRAAHPRA